ncbi:hypothetical protein, partial [Actinoplanes sp. TFC3]|uniref:hypothetical protein n=1 Tax=Actinoplanes sp. TFC3 TaxID=1710355 RepID=UPI00083307C6
MNLEQHYRLLLRAYPRRFRTQHGAEMLTTLLEMATHDRRRPHRTDVLHLITSGLRHRFRLPAGRRTTLLAAVLLALITGAFGAAAGSWARLHTTAGLPAAHELADLTGAPGDYTTTTAGPSAFTAPMVTAATGYTHDWQPTTAQQRFTAAGWHITATAPFHVTAQQPGPATQAGTANPAPLPGLDTDQSAGLEFTAVKNGLEAHLRGYATPEGDAGFVTVSATAVPTAPAPAALTGTALGLLLGWLLAAALTYRITGSLRPRTAGTCLTAALLVLTPPA